MSKARPPKPPASNTSSTPTPTPTKKRPPGAGTVDQRESGRWRVRLRNADGKQKPLGTYETEAEARAVLASALDQLADAQTAPVGPRTLKTWGHTWLLAREAEGIRGIAQEKSVWSRHVASHSIADLPLRDITRRQLLEWLDAVRKTKAVRPKRGGGVKATSKAVSRRVVLHALHLMRGAVRAARDANHMREDVTAGVVPPRNRGAVEDPWTYLTAAEVEMVRTCERIPDPERAIYTVAMFTGLRRGELWGLRWSDVRLGDVEGQAPEVTVRRSNKGTTKTGKTRQVPLLPQAIEALKRLKVGSSNVWVFPTELGGQRGKDDDARWAPQQRKARKDGSAQTVCGYRLRTGIARRVRFHDLRHTCASHLLMGTWGVALTLPEVAQWLGHSSVTMTERYAHLAPDRLAMRVSGVLAAVARVPSVPTNSAPSTPHTSEDPQDSRP